MIRGKEPNMIRDGAKYDQGQGAKHDQGPTGQGKGESEKKGERQQCYPVSSTRSICSREGDMRGAHLCTPMHLHMRAHTHTLDAAPNWLCAQGPGQVREGLGAHARTSVTGSACPCSTGTNTHMLIAALTWLHARGLGQAREGRGAQHGIRHRAHIQQQRNGVRGGVHKHGARGRAVGE